MARPEITRDMQTLLRTECIDIRCLIELTRGGGEFFASAVAPIHAWSDPTWGDGLIYATGAGPTPEDALEQVREKMWNGL